MPITTPYERVIARTVEGPVIKPELGPCLDCTYANISGYPVLAVGGRSGRVIFASRVVLEHVIGRSIADGMQVNHHCDRPSCVRDAHLYEGTQRDNIGDAIRRGRMSRGERHSLALRTPRGEQHYRAALNDEAVKVIRRLYVNGVSQKRLAKAHGLNQSTISRVCAGRRWANKGII